MPTLTYACLIYADGAQAPAELPPGFSFAALLPAPRLQPDDELYGPFATTAHKALASAKEVYLLHARREVTRDSARFFAEAHQVVQAIAQKSRGWALDVLRLWPVPLEEAASLPLDPLGEDLFSIGFTHHGAVWRAETHGLCKLDQREVVLEFKEDALREEAAIFCAHLADYVLGQNRRVAHGQALSFGYDAVSFLASEGAEAVRDLREFHAPFVRRVLTPDLFPGTGRLEVHAEPGLTAVLRVSQDQRLLLDDLGVVGESPHQATRAWHCSCVGTDGRVVGNRMDPLSPKDSGWTFTCANPHPSSDLIDEGLKELVQKVPVILRYLALPPGSTVRLAGDQVDVETLDADLDEA